MPELFTPLGGRVPPDIWYHIANVADTGTAKQLCETSSDFLHITRPALYRDLHLKGIHSYNRCTLELLCTDKTLAKHVRLLSLHEQRIGTFEMKDSSQALLSRIFLDAVANMSDLRPIRLQDVYLIGTATEELVKHVKTHRIPLRNFENRLIRETNLYDGLKSQCISFPGLTSLTWNVLDRKSYREELPSSVMGLLEASRETLQSLTFGPNSAWESHQRLWSMHFPCLLSLKLGPWENWGCQIGSAAVTRFLLAHEQTLRELDFNQRLPQWWRNMHSNIHSFCPFTPVVSLNAKLLPHLRILKCSVPLFLFLIRIGAEFLQITLEQLELTSERNDNYQSHWQAACETLYLNKKPSGLAALKELSIDMKYVDDHHQRRVEFNRIAADPSPFSYVAPPFSACGANIETLNLRNLACNNSKELVDALRSLDQLRAIHLPLKAAEQENFWDDSEGQDKHRQGLIWELAQACPKLREGRRKCHRKSRRKLPTTIGRDCEGRVRCVERVRTIWRS